MSSPQTIIPRPTSATSTLSSTLVDSLSTTPPLTTATPFSSPALSPTSTVLPTSPHPLNLHEAATLPVLLDCVHPCEFDTYLTATSSTRIFQIDRVALSGGVWKFMLSYPPYIRSDRTLIPWDYSEKYFPPDVQVGHTVWVEYLAVPALARESAMTYSGPVMILQQLIKFIQSEFKTILPVQDMAYDFRSQTLEGTPGIMTGISLAYVHQTPSGQLLRSLMRNVQEANIP